MPRKTSQNSISLFPFLAVLVCTMGALILLLLVTTRQIQKEKTQLTEVVEVDPLTAEIFDGLDAESLQLPDISEVQDFVIEPSYQDPFLVDEDDDREAEIVQLKSDLESENRKLGELQLEIDVVKQQLSEVAEDSQASQQQLAMLEEQEAELKDSLEQKEQQLAGLNAELDEQSARTEKAEQVLRARESALVSLRKIVRAAEGAAGTDAALLEFTNSTGTQRSPIVIDVNENGLEFAGFDIRLAEKDLEGFPANDNPLLAGIAALHAHRFPDTLVSQPYVLLLLRPSGTMMFYAIQRSLGESGIHFGYELLDEDRRVAADRASTQEQSVLRKAIEEAMRRRTHLYGKAGGGAASDDGQKGMRVTPDGRVVLAEETPEGHSGRFYAGDSPLPNEMRRPQLPETVFGEPENGEGDAAINAESSIPDADNSDDLPLLGELDSQKQFGQMEQDSPTADNGFDFDDLTQMADGETTDEPFPEIFPKATVEPTPEKESPESLFASAFPELSEIDAAEVDRLTPSDILGRPSAISGNLGVNGGRDIGIPARAVDNVVAPETLDGKYCGEDVAPFLVPQPKPYDHQPPETPADKDDSVFDVPARSEEPTESDRPSAPVPGVPMDIPGLPQPSEEIPAEEPAKNIDAQPETADFDSDRTDSLERFDWPEAATADATRETRPVESPESRNPFAEMADGNSSGGGSGPQAPADSMLQQLMQNQKAGVPGTKQSSNPVLRGLLKSATDDDPKLVGYQPVTIRIDAEMIAVGNQNPFSTEGMDSKQLLEATLKGLAREVAKLPNGIDSDTTPTIDYTVGKGAVLTWQRLAASLERMDVPTRTMLNVRFNFSPPAPQSQAHIEEKSPTPKASRPPAVPIDDGSVSGTPSRTTEVSEPRSQNRRLAL